MTNIERDAMAWLQAQQFVKSLRQYRGMLTAKQLREVRGQALAGDIPGARKGLETMLREVKP